MITTSPRRRLSSVQSSSPATLPLDITAPARVVQKQVIQICAHSKGCSVVLFMRLALPKSSKKRSYALFPEVSDEEGIRLKSSAVYPVSVDKAGKTLLPQNASPTLKRASRILAIRYNAPETPLANTFAEAWNSDDSGSENNIKQVKPRLISDLQITIPQSGEEHTDASEKLYYLAVIQIEVGLHKAPPNWPFEAHIPIPRCLNNKLHFTRDEEGAESDQRMVVDFEPRLVQRSVGGPFESSSYLDAELEGGDSACLMEDGPQTAVSGSFPATSTIIARWAPVHAAADISQHAYSGSGYLPVPAHSLAINGQVEDKFDELGLHTIEGEEGKNPADTLGDWSGVIEDVNTSVWITYGPPSISKRRKAVYRVQISWPYVANPVLIPSAQAGVVQQTPRLLPRLVLALQRACVDEKVDLLHASIQGKPVQVVFDTQDSIDTMSKNDAIPSKMIDIRLPEYMRNTEGQIMATLVYSVEGPSSSSALNLFAPVASTVTYFHTRIHDEALQDSVPILAYSSEPLSSSVHCDEQHHVATVEASMLASMTSVTMEYVKRTKPLVPLSPPPIAPLRRQSVMSNTPASAMAASLLPSVRTPEPKEKSAPILPATNGERPVQFKRQQNSQEPHHLITWSTFHAFLLVVLACSLYNVNFNIIPSVQQISRKVDVMGMALNLDFANDGQHLQYSDPNLKTATSPSANNQLAVQQPYANSLAIPNTGGISDFVTWLSMALSWPLRRILSIFSDDNH
ncbi:uncharacterized protein FA14DRAFT_159757 [Meira miltonrushii]|uniref:Uncharacterized protein n=1 Tax=Meira miltonrushii TaxID=1280837 RepID=A0A316VPA3_9BASI|nr:uncharacterized protein FA14DRAFT_159757 [Meira miltonrushii]PWN37961.1 hypothetical protein FA14DRAFT_159757 [Meira miltonrushii]